MGTDDVWVQLATRIPKTLHREVKLSCVRSDVSVMKFVVQAIAEKLQRDTTGQRVDRRPPGSRRGEGAPRR